MSELKDRLATALKQRQMTAGELARLSGLNKGSISRYLKGEFTPKKEAVDKMAHVLMVSPDWLERGSDELPDYLVHPENYPTQKTDFHSFQELKDDYKKEVERYIEFLLKKQKEEESGQ